MPTSSAWEILKRGHVALKLLRGENMSSVIVAFGFQFEFEIELITEIFQIVKCPKQASVLPSHLRQASFLLV